MNHLVILFIVILVINSCSHHPHHPSVLEPGKKTSGITRSEPKVIGEGILAKSPHITVSPQGKIFSAVTNYDPDKDIESIWIYPIDEKKWQIGEGKKISHGNRAWGAKLVFDHKERLWATWCGWDANKQASKNHNRVIYLKMVYPTQGLTEAVSNSSHYNCGVDIKASENALHLAWESEQGIKYLTYQPQKAKFTKEQIIAAGWKNRRAALAIWKDKVALTWDEWQDPYPTGALDPDYDLYVKIHDGKKWSKSKIVDDGPGIQAAGNPAFNSRGELLVAYHSNNSFPLVKFWNIRKLDNNGKWWQLLQKYPDPNTLPASEVQGAEFPALLIGPSDKIAILSRPSHGHYLHIINGEEILSYDLTRAGWGARDIFAYGTFIDAKKLLLIRRARLEVVLEKIELDRVLEPAKFMPVKSMIKKQAPLLKKKELKLSNLKDDKKIFFGDVHQHSGYSDGTGTPDEIYARSYARGFDFSILTDHDNIVRSRLFPSQHMEIAWTTDQFNKLRDFSTIHGYEWTTPIIPHGHGHRNIYFKHDPPIPLYNYRGDAGSTKELYEKLRPHKVFTAPHHTGWTGTDWEGVDPKIQRHVEITSVHGAYEDHEDNPFKTRSEMKNMFARNFLREGHEFGFIAGSDGHGLFHHHGIARHTDPWAHGLTGVFAKKNSRENIWDSLYHRENFATSGPNIGIYATLNNHPMGSDLKVNSNQITLDYSIDATGPILEVKIVKDGEKTFIQSKKNEGRFVDQECNPGRHNYYLRVIQQTKDGQKDMAWSSPFFVTCGESN